MILWYEFRAGHGVCWFWADSVTGSKRVAGFPGDRHLRHATSRRLTPREQAKVRMK